MGILVAAGGGERGRSDTQELSGALLLVIKGLLVMTDHLPEVQTSGCQRMLHWNCSDEVLKTNVHFTYPITAAGKLMSVLMKQKSLGILGSCRVRTVGFVYSL